MTFTSSLPTEPGFYAWKKDTDDSVITADYLDAESISECREIGGLWCRLVPEDEPKPTLRPWKPEEVPVGALIRGSHHGVRVIMGYGKVDNSSNLYVLYWGHCEMTGDGLIICLQDREHSLDNGRTWHPCGILEG